MAFLLVPALVSAQQFLPEPVQYVISPEVPGPNEQVTIEAQGVGLFLGDAQITWQQDGKTVKSGAGESSYTFTTGALGSVTRISISIQSKTTGSFKKEFVVRPSSVNLVWEADTVVPRLYQGKALYSGGSMLKVVAFPSVVINGSRVAPQSLSYNWSRGGDIMPAQSGLGRNTLTFQGDQLQTAEEVVVDVYFGTNLVARGGVGIPAAEPQLRFYERDALRGILYDSALPEGILLTKKEITLFAQPYYFSSGGLPRYSWMLGGNETTGPDSERGVLTLRQTGTGSGQADLAAEVQNDAVDQLVQAADRTLTIFFGGQSSGASLFGI